MTIDVSFQFHNNQLTYYPGSVIYGTVTYNLQKDYSTSGINVALVGKAEIHWSERHNKKTRNYRNKEKFFKIVIKVYDADVHGTTIRKGIYAYPFSFQLPNGIPSTFKFNRFATANVTYRVKSEFFRNGLHFNVKRHGVFTVLGTDQLNVTNPLTPVVASNEKTLCCWFCKEGPIKTQVTLDRNTYKPGETITFNATIENLSSTNIYSILVSLTRNVKLVSHTKTRTFSDVVLSVGYGSCSAGQPLYLTNKQITLPIDIAPSTLPYCNIIDVDYILEFKANFNGCNMAQKIPLQVIIGAIVPGQPAMGQPLGPPAVGQPLGPPAVGQPLVPPAMGQPLGPPAMGQPLGPPATVEPSAPYQPSNDAQFPSTGGYYNWGISPKP